MFKRPYYIAFAIVLFLVVVIFNLPHQTTTQFKLALSAFFLPLLGLASSTQNLKDHAANALIPRSVLVEEVQRLRSENDQLRFQAIQSSELWLENDRLREALTWRQKARWKPKLARVILRDPSNWWRTLHINLGKNQGVTTNMPVMTPEGLVGKIFQVGPNMSQVVLIGDPNCKVAVKIKETGDNGAITTSAGPVSEPSIVTLSFLDRKSKVQPGHQVVTSGLQGGIFPPGLPIGHIVDVSSVDFGMYLDARVKLRADLNKLEEVFVLLE